MRKMDWPELIGLLILLKEKLAMCDEDAPYGCRAPRVGATEARLRQLESEIGGPLDGEHRELLGHVDGWSDFLFTNEVLSTGQLRDADVRAEVLEFSSLDGENYPEDEWLPLARATHDRDTMLIGRPGSAHAGQVIWLAGEAVDTFDDVRDWFLAMIDCHRRALARHGVTDLLAP